MQISSFEHLFGQEGTVVAFVLVTTTDVCLAVLVTDVELKLSSAITVVVDVGAALILGVMGVMLGDERVPA